MKRTLEQLDLLRLGVAAPEHRVADVSFNCDRIEEVWRRARSTGIQLLLTPELSLTGYTCGDLFFQPTLQRAALDGLERLEHCTAEPGPALVVGLPLQIGGRIYNCAALVAEGRTVGIVPKTYLPQRGEYYEQRHFTPGGRADEPEEVEFADQTVPFGTDLLFELEGYDATVGIELCEDLWAPIPPSSRQALAGASLLLNLSASDELIGKLAYRRELVRQQSARCLATYAYAGTGSGESTTDMVFAGHCMVAENGVMLAETERFGFASKLVYADVDQQRLRLERTLNSSFAQSTAETDCRILPFAVGPAPTVDTGPDADETHLLRRPISSRPFVPDDERQRAAHCDEIFAIQATGLAKRLRHTGCESVVIGVSGGLDSTLALLVTHRAFASLDLDPKDIHALTMPGFGTTERTRSNATRLAESLGASLRSIPIDDAVRQHFADIDHDESIHDVTYENAQARERTQILMDWANRTGGFVVGTGDLSEAALGWCTYNADHMSMYHVNIGVPKTLVRYVVEQIAAESAAEVRALLEDICATPITPELLPLADGELVQETEQTVGPYELHDFFLFHTVRHPYPPAKVLFYAAHAFQGRYDVATIGRWLDVFYRRFFAQQYKRSAMPDGPKVGSVALSPRADWRMPSDASPNAWLDELEDALRWTDGVDPPASDRRGDSA